MRPYWLVPILLVALVFAVFFQVRDHEFVDYDDHSYILENPNLSDGLGATLLSPSSGYTCVSLGLVRLQTSTDVLAHVDIRDVDGDNLESGVRVKTPVQDVARDAVRVLQHFQVAVRRTDRRDNAFADAGHNASRLKS